MADPFDVTDSNANYQPSVDTSSSSPDFYRNLMNFGLATMAAGSKPGATTLGALGQGGLEAMQSARENAQARTQQQLYSANANLANTNAYKNLMEAKMQQYQLGILQNSPPPPGYGQQPQQQDLTQNIPAASPSSVTTSAGNTPQESSGMAGPIWSNTAGNIRQSQNPQTNAYKVGNISLPPNASPMAIGTSMVESGGMDYNPNGSPVTSPKGAMYGMQVMPSTAANPGLGVNPAKDNSPAEMNRVGVDYQNALLKKYNGNQTLAAAAYNAGPTAVDNALLQSNNDPQKALGLLPKETQNYVVKIANATNKPPAAGSTSNTPNPMAALKEARYIWAMQNPKAAAIYGINPKDYEPPDGMTYSGDGSGRLVPVQGNKNTDPQAVSDAKAAQEAGTNVADATKTFNVAASNFPRAMQRFEQLRQAASDASYGIGVDEKEPGSTGDFNRVFAKTFLAQYIEPKTAVANQIMEQATNQGVLSELGPQLAGLKGNKFLEGIASGASGLDLADPPAAKLNAINGLQDQYISNMKSLISQRRNYGDKTAPTELELSNLIAQHAKPTDMISVVDPKGNLGRVPASDLASLVQDGGQIR